MNIKKRNVQMFLFVICLSLSMVSCAKPALVRGLFQPARAADSRPETDKVVIRDREVTVDFEQLRGRENQRLILSLFDDVVLHAIRDREEMVGEAGYVWHGHIEGESGSSVALAVKGKVLIGNIITQRGKFYQIRYLDGGIHRVREIDPSRIPPEADPLIPELRAETQADTCSTDPPTDIDLLVVYTDDARAAAGGIDAIEATVFLAISETNQSYFNSNIVQRVRLVHIAEENYAETGNSSTDLNRLRTAGDTFLDNVPILRNTHAADAVVMITESLDACGRGYLMTSVSNGFETSAYSVVARQNCATGNYSFGHELGHNMGARHDWIADSTNNSPYPYNHGHLVTAPNATGTSPWRTIMSYNSSCQTQASVNCTRIMYWSNPFISYPPGVTPNDPMGTGTGTQQTDNHQALDNTALTVANFRCSSPGVTNVWMKDTWNDTGLEPDPATAAENMWTSPYVWVRNTQDTNLTFQHQHQNPELGSDNWVYVKLHNGSNTTASGTLEIYYANASTSLTWPSTWTLIGSVSVSGFTSQSTRIAEQKWTGLPGTGHYCLLARWVSPADPMATAEGTDINANVRSNNNLVWRNLDIVDLVSDESRDEEFILRNDSRENSAATLIIQGPRTGRLPSFLAHGEVFIQLDEKLMDAWKRGGGKGSGIKLGDYGFKISAEGGRIEQLMLSPMFEGHVKIRFRRVATTPRRRFMLDIVQMIKERTIGGISYEVRTDSTD